MKQLRIFFILFCLAMNSKSVIIRTIFSFVFNMMHLVDICVFCGC